MRVPVYFKQCRTVQEAGLIAFKLRSEGFSDNNIIVWPEHQLVGVIEDTVRVKFSGLIDTKVCFYDQDEKDYELGAWSDKIRLFERTKKEVLQMTFNQVAEEYFKRNGIADAAGALADRVEESGWPAPRFFIERGINSFECMFDCENHMRKVLVSELIFDSLDAKHKIFRKERGAI